MTLVELVISIVVIGIAAAAMFSAMAAITARSADPMLRQQSLVIAEAYMEEISLQAFADPDRQPGGTAGGALLDDVGDYDGLDEAPHADARGEEIGVLGGLPGASGGSFAGTAWPAASVLPPCAFRSPSPIPPANPPSDARGPQGGFTDAALTGLRQWRRLPMWERARPRRWRRSEQELRGQGRFHGSSPCSRQVLCRVVPAWFHPGRAGDGHRPGGAGGGHGRRGDVAPDAGLRRPEPARRAGGQGQRGAPAHGPRRAPGRAELADGRRRPDADAVDCRGGPLSGQPAGCRRAPRRTRRNAPRRARPAASTSSAP